MPTPANPPAKNDTPEYPDTLLSAQSFLMLLLALVAGMLAGIILLPLWVPQLSASLRGTDPKAFWFLSRGSAFVALTLLWASMALGLLMTNKMARSWPGVPVSFAIHEFISLLGLGFALFHVLILLGDRYIQYDLFQLAIPFASSYQPLWVGVGQLGFYILLLITFSFYVRQKIGQKSWRMLHYVSFLTYLMAVLHGLGSGTDTATPWGQTYYWISGGSVLFLFIYRIVINITTKLPANKLATVKN